MKFILNNSCGLKLMFNESNVSKVYSVQVFKTHDEILVLKRNKTSVESFKLKISVKVTSCC